MKKLFLLFAISIVANVFAQKQTLSLDQAILAYQKGLTPNSLSNLQWVDDSENYIYKDNEKYIIKSAKGKTITSFGVAKFKKDFPELKKLPSIKSINTKSLIFTYNNQLVSFDYKKGKALNQLQFDEEATNIDIFSANQLAFTIDNNLYVTSDKQAKIAITAILDKNIVSGQAIHRYEFGISKGTFWSPKGACLAFYQKDETNVSNYPLVDVSTYPASLNNIKYPMAGQASEIAKIGIYSLKNNTTIYLDIDTKDEHYLTNLSWSPDEKYVFVAEVNRGQNHYQFNRYDVATGKKVNTLFEEKSNKWVEPEHDAVFLPNSNDEFLWLSEDDGFKNLYRYHINGKEKKQLTHFKFIIKSILGFDAEGEHVIISATGPDGRNTLTYKVNLADGKSEIITKKEGVHYTQLNDKGSYLIDNYSTLTTPRIINIINVNTKKSKTILTAENPLTNYVIGSTELDTIAGNQGFDLFTRMIKPANFDPSKKYPVLIYVYGGTHAQMVTNSWLGNAPLWMHWMANQKDYIIFTLDNRGSGNRGFAFESVIHRIGGEPAMEDQLLGVEYLKSLNFVDSKRIAVHGWSYGGFMASSLIMRYPATFTTAVAGGPVTDWKYYEVMYGERYMDTPQENPEGYANARVGKYLDQLTGKLLLIHGSIDPTVLPQHSMTLLKEAVDKNVQLDFFTYPMHPHNVRGKDRIHLMQKVLDYIDVNNH